MPETINWSFSVGAVNGPRIAGSDGLVVDAYDKLSLVLEAGDTAINVDLQPSAAEGRVRALVIAASAYDAAITFSADGGTTVPSLLGPLVLIGAGAVGLLDATPQTLQFANSTAEPTTLLGVLGDTALASGNRGARVNGPNGLTPALVERTLREWAESANIEIGFV